MNLYALFDLVPTGLGGRSTPFAFSRRGRFSAFWGGQHVEICVFKIVIDFCMCVLFAPRLFLRLFIIRCIVKGRAIICCGRWREPIIVSIVLIGEWGADSRLAHDRGVVDGVVLVDNMYSVSVCGKIYVNRAATVICRRCSF